jgi:hypothetical protein
LALASTSDGVEFERPEHPDCEADRTLFKEWIAAGGVWGSDPVRPGSTASRNTDWWSLKPLQRPPLAVVGDTNWVRNPIDRFVLAKLEAKGFQPSPEAGRPCALEFVVVQYPSSVAIISDGPHTGYTTGRAPFLVL